MRLKFIFSKRLPELLFIAALVVLVGAAPTAKKKALPSAAAPHLPAGIHFADVTQASGIRFVHNNGAFGKKYLPETLGPGCAFIDYDNDGYPDILLVNGQDWPGHPISATAQSSFSTTIAMERLQM
ncbi:MAG: VCBS repeat-containing protein [Candidatus Angelobacter sp.]